jgi:hypothetical protein
MIKNTLKRFSTALSCLIGLGTVAATTTVHAEPTPVKVCRFSGAVNDPALLRGCTTVVGDVHVEHSKAENLAALSALQNVTGTLFIAENERLSSLEGLSNLRSVGGLVVSQNPTLGDFAGLDKLERALRLEITGNRSLSVVSGPDGLRTLDRLVVRDNGLFRLGGFRNLTSVKDVIIAKNPKLIYMSGLAHLTSVDNLFLADNPRLAPILGFFASRVTVRRELSVTHCPGVHPGDLRRAG